MRCSMQSNSAVAVAETVQHFITAMDSLKLNMVAVDQVRAVAHVCNHVLLALIVHGLRPAFATGQPSPVSYRR